MSERPHIDLRCSCSGEMVGVISPVEKLQQARAIFLSVHNEPGCTVTDCSSDVAPPAQHEVRQAGAAMLPGLEMVPEKPAERGQPWKA